MERKKKEPIPPSSTYVCETCSTELLSFGDFRVHLRNAHDIPLEEKVSTVKQMRFHMDAARSHTSIFQHTITRGEQTIIATHSYVGPK